jgi:penicillin-binding protein 1A
VISAEDRRFREHAGVDAWGILRALTRNVRAGEIVEGGSTITQQLVKILYLESDRTFKRKIQEAIIAIWLEQKLGKDEVLARYLNNVYLGAGATGMPAAVAGGRLRAAEAAAAKQEFAQLRPTKPVTRSGSWFADWVSEEAREIAGPYRGTIEVRTSLVPRLQALAEQVIRTALEKDGTAAGASQAALVAMAPDGAVVAMVGGRDYDDSSFNRAVTARRQPGSAFKLFTYYAALKSGVSLDDRITDEPVKIGDWAPENFDGGYRGTVTVEDAFAQSLNAATVRLAMEVGIPNVIAAARELGIDAGLNDTPSVALGSYEVSLLDLTGAYASVRAGHAPIEPWGIISFHADGQPRSFKVGTPKLPETDLVHYQTPLVELLQRVVERGTGRAAAIDGVFAAGKTGTSQNFRDAWFVGFTEPLVVGVWVGNDNDTPMNKTTGGKLPARIWHDFMLAALDDMDSGSSKESVMAPLAGVDQPPAQADEETESSPAVDGQAVASENAPLDQINTGAVARAEATPSATCDYALCSRMYRSFRPEDCTYQPFSGPRRLCTRASDPDAQAAEADLSGDAPVAAEATVTVIGDEALAAPMAACNYRVCSRFYRSFRPSDCTYQPYDGGPRELCSR